LLLNQTLKPLCKVLLLYFYQSIKNKAKTGP
jgi:hypothetical protein